MFFIYLNGKPQSGKDTMAEALHHQYNVVRNIEVGRERFASPLRDIIGAVRGSFRDTHEFKSQQFLPSNTYTVREAMIKISEEFFKEYWGLSCWADALTMRIKSMPFTNQGWIISDLGFHYELTAMYDHWPDAGHYVVRMVRPDTPIIADSRQIISGPDFTINNNGSRSDLRTAAEHLATEIAKKESSRG